MADGPGRLNVIKRLIIPVKLIEDIAQAGTLSLDDIDDVYLPHARETLYARLSRWYQTPFVKITRDGEQFYPYPIDMLVELIAAGNILVDEYHEQSGTMRASDKGNSYLARAETLILRIQQREIILEGQRTKAEGVFAAQTIRPPELVPSPTTPGG